MEEITLTMPHLEAVLHDYADEVRRLYQENLVKSDRLASEELYNSVETDVLIEDTVYRVTLTLADYWKYVEDDTRPHWPPVDALIKWIAVKPVIPRPDSRGRIPTPRSLAYLIGRKIAEKGTKGSHDLRDTLTEVNAHYAQLITAALAQDVEDIARQSIITFLSLRR